jgi:hypothetical protein
MPTSVMPIWTVDRKRPGSSASLRAARAPERPASAMVLSRGLRAETTASSESANTPLSRMRQRATNSSNTLA